LRGIRGLLIAIWAIVTGLASLLGFAFTWFVAPPADREGFVDWLSSPVAWVFNLPLWVVVVALAGLAGLAVVGIWRRRNTPDSPESGGRLLVRYDYQHADSSVAVSVFNDGLQPVEWFTIEVTSAAGTFGIGHISSVAGLKTSGLGGSFTTISGERLLPGERGCVMLNPVVGSSIKLLEPAIKTDTTSAFCGEIHTTVHPMEAAGPES